jgi:hypothetical protein
MNVSRVLPALSRRALALGLAAAMCAASGVRAQQTPGQDPAPAKPQEAPDALKLSLDGPVLILNTVKPDKVTEFLAGWTMVRAEFAKSTRPEVQAFAATFTKMFKVDPTLIGQPADPQSVIYIFQIDTPSKTQSYNPVKIVYELLHKNGEEGGISRADADAIYAKFTECYKNIIVWPLVKAGG